MSETEWNIKYTKQGLNDKKTACANGFKAKIDSLLEVLKNNPFDPYPPYEKLIGDLEGAYSRRINREHRLVYAVDKYERVVKIISAWTHYE